MRSLILLALLASLPAPALAADITGTASVIDGDTLDIRRTRIRLHGVDAPEGAQLCDDAAGRSWRCGHQAAVALSSRIGRQTVTCAERDVDCYGRIVAVCSAGNEDPAGDGPGNRRLSIPG